MKIEIDFYFSGRKIQNVCTNNTFAFIFNSQPIFLRIYKLQCVCNVDVSQKTKSLMEITKMIFAAIFRKTDVARGFAPMNVFVSLIKWLL